ncbi:MAG: hypothetical protein RI953_19 [Pseudomonadota bacterium]|jgi:hypothetical protein
MAFWAKKKAEVETEKKDNGTNNLLKKKDEKKSAPPKRIDNLRIAQKLQISLKSLGTGNEYHFLTKDLSATGMFVLCSDHKRYPFHVQSTLLETVIQLKAGDDEAIELRCLCKIARLVEGQVTGFGVRIVQISPEQKVVLEQFIAKHGSPDNFVPYSGGQKPPADAKTQEAAPPTPAVNSESNEIGQDTTPAQLATSA